MKHPLRKTKTYGTYRDWDGIECKIPVWFNYNGNKMWITYTDEDGDIQMETVRMGNLGYCANCLSLPEVEDILFKYWEWRNSK